MPLPTNLHEFLRYQARACDIANRTLTLLAIGGAAARDQLASVRWEAVRILREYQIYKHHRIFDPLIAERSFRSYPAARMKQQCEALGQSYVEHTMRWSTGANADDWHEYRQAVEQIIDDILVHIDKERRGVIKLLAIPVPITQSAMPAAASQPPVSIGYGQSQKRTGT